jgi:formylglycine-generating enzyme
LPFRRLLLSTPLLLGASCCSRPPPGADGSDAGPKTSVAIASATAEPSASAGTPAASASSTGDLPAPQGSASAEPLHRTSLEELLRLFSVRTLSEKEIKRRGDPDMFLRKNFGVETPARINQGNPALAQHDVTREKCLEGLRDVAVQTPEQREICGAENMVPVYRRGVPEKAKACIDVFEFPNKPCELPFVWIAPTQAATVCELQGKRLCAQEEWVMACRAHPDDEEDSIYAYGNELDLAACNTNKSAPTHGGAKCDDDSARTAWNTCPSNTEPAGSFPRCRSRLGVFDMHGNVAEIMTRWDPDGHNYSQLKGSAFFYVDVARKHTERQREGARETYPDHCAHDPRWHVEPMDNAWHVNYHLGFRCCKTLHPK